MKAVFDTNILIDYLKGITEARDELERFSKKYISIISYIETLVGVGSSFFQEVVDFLESFEIIPVNKTVADLSVMIRQQYKLKIPDAIILASAQSLEALLVTRNAKDFPITMPMVRLPYQI